LETEEKGRGKGIKKGHAEKKPTQYRYHPVGVSGPSRQEKEELKIWEGEKSRALEG